MPRITLTTDGSNTIKVVEGIRLVPCGLSLRQLYAAFALTGILARPCDHKRTAEQRAAEARPHADAMIEARI